MADENPKQPLETQRADRVDDLPGRERAAQGDEVRGGAASSDAEANSEKIRGGAHALRDLEVKSDEIRGGLQPPDGIRAMHLVPPDT